LTLDEVAAVVEGNAVNLAPVDTGNLRGTIYRKMISPTEAEVGAAADYAVYVEFGTGDGGTGGGRKWTYYSEALQRFVTTSGMKAQPFLRPALDGVRSRLGRFWARAKRRFGR
jgi:HK97 gp10 family phage protein